MIYAIYFKGLLSEYGANGTGLDTMADHEEAADIFHAISEHILGKYMLVDESCRGI